MNVLALVALLLLFIAGTAFATAFALKSRATQSVPLEPKIIDISATPDHPISFGRKNLWIVVPSEEPAALVELLGLCETVPCNWQSGFLAAYAYPSDYVFVTPPVQGWVFAVGTALPDPSDPSQIAVWRSFLTALSRHFSRAFFFATHRGSSYSAWALFESGRERRLFAYDGHVIHNVGDPLLDEQDLMQHLFDPDSAEAQDEDYWERQDLRAPEEDDVFRLAAAWTVDPSTIESLGLPPSVGLVGYLDHQQRPAA